MDHLAKLKAVRINRLLVDDNTKRALKTIVKVLEVILQLYFVISQIIIIFAKNLSDLLVVVVVVGYPTPSEGLGAWRKTMEPQKPGNSQGSGPEVVERQRVAKE